MKPRALATQMEHRRRHLAEFIASIVSVSNFHDGYDLPNRLHSQNRNLKGDSEELIVKFDGRLFFNKMNLIWLTCPISY